MYPRESGNRGARVQTTDRVSQTTNNILREENLKLLSPPVIRQILHT